MFQYDTHHIDGNRLNNDPSNLEYIRRHQHFIRHLDMNQPIPAWKVYERCNDVERSELVAFSYEIKECERIYQYVLKQRGWLTTDPA